MSEQHNIMGTTTLFVYGTLQFGFENHVAYCSTALSIQKATVRGRLYELPNGIPVLEVPDKDIIGVGSTDIAADLELQRRLESQSILHPECNGQSWEWIEGELVVLPDPEKTIPPVDRLEGFRPQGVSFYRRVFVPVVRPDESTTTAWCYVAGPGTARMLVPTGRTSWG